MIEKLREYFANCPYLQKSEHGFVIVNVDYLNGKSVNYSLETIGGESWYQRYQGTNHGIKRLDFVFASMETYSSELFKNINSLKFYDNLAEWVDNNEPPKPIADITIGRPQLQFVVDGEDLARYEIVGNILYVV